MAVGVKICGVTSADAVKAVVDNGAEYIGFVFFSKSPRNVTAEKAAQLAKLVPSHVKKVAVMVNITDDELRSMLAHFTPDILQLHGSESEARVQEIKDRFHITVMKAIAVRSGDDIAQAMRYSNVADMLLFDAKAPETSVLPGGNGLSFDWNLLSGRSFPLPWMLSGGINIDNMEEAVTLSGATIVDVSSSVELRPGVKSPALIEAFIKKAHGL